MERGGEQPAVEGRPQQRHHCSCECARRYGPWRQPVHSSEQPSNGSAKAARKRQAPAVVAGGVKQRVVSVQQRVVSVQQRHGVVARAPGATKERERVCLTCNATEEKHRRLWGDRAAAARVGGRAQRTLLNRRILPSSQLTRNEDGRTTAAAAPPPARTTAATTPAAGGAGVGRRRRWGRRSKRQPPCTTCNESAGLRQRAQLGAM